MRQQIWDGSRPAQIENIKRQSLRNVTKLLSIYMKDYLLFTFILLFLKAHS